MKFLLFCLSLCLFVKNSLQDCSTISKEVREVDNSKKTQKVTSCSVTNLPQGKSLNAPNYEPYLQITNRLTKYSHLYPNAFINVPKLKWLYIENIGLESVDSNAFRGLTNLQSLSLSRNKLSLMPDKTIFIDMPKLVSLRVQDNTIKTIDDFYFVNSNLKNLYLNKNKISSLSSNWSFGLNKLIRLDLSDNFLAHLLGHMFQNLENLEYLYLDRNGVDKIETSTFVKLRKLKGLYLSNNKLKTINEPIFILPTLKYLDLGSNQISALTGNWHFGLDNLIRFNISSNAFASLTTEKMFKELASLEKLEISPAKGKFFEVQVGILKGLEKLKYLDMGTNNVSFKFLHDIHDLKYDNLKYVHVDGEIVFDEKKKWWQG